MMNLFQPSVKLVRKVRRGSRLTRRYDRPQTPLDRLVASGVGDTVRIAALQQLRNRWDPFVLAQMIDRKLRRIYRSVARALAPSVPAPRVPRIPGGLR
jgi:hypothetical protein